jgi:hypothetical protein
MQKKHSFSPNHKVVTDSKHNFHQNGAPSTASMGQPPQSIGGGGGEQPGGDSDGSSATMNFCNGGRYDDGGSVFEKAGEFVSRLIPGGGNNYDPNDRTPAAKAGISTGNKETPYEGSGGKAREDAVMNTVDEMSK